MFLHLFMHTRILYIFADSVNCVKMSVGKLVIRGTSKMTLHDRFTQLDYQVGSSQLSILPI